MKLLLRICYDGSAYCGYQYQPSLPTVQGTLTESMSQLFGTQCLVTGCSRTDAGVHALGYVASVEPADISLRGEEWWKIPLERIHRAAIKYLPSDIAVTGVAAVRDDFHPRYDVVQKEYIYKISDDVCFNPFLRDRALMLGRRLSDRRIETMNTVAVHLLGRHDFSSFMASGSSITDTTRTLYKLETRRESEDMVEISVRGDGFLYNMVRIIVGTLLDTAFDKLSERDFCAVLDGRDRRLAGATAPACGLYLKEVCYAENIVFSAE